MLHDHLCTNTSEGLCFDCAEIESIREDDRYRVLEQISAMPQTVNRNDIINAIRPLTGDILRRKEPRADLGFGPS